MTDPEAGRGRRHLVWLTLLVLALVPFLLIEGHAANVLRRFGLTDRDEAFTELYFPDHVALPTTLSAGQPFAFDFSIRNREGAPRDYSWQVVVRADASTRSAGQPTVIADGAVRLADGEVRVVHNEHADGLPAGPAVVAVVLVGRTETIQFPVAVTRSG